ncbi:hypothetical protein RZS08_11880, partial [Arthrospira platensis SPKY1]|nr:hypothetical protein [Arthrospira platensis SPKY1]
NIIVMNEIEYLIYRYDQISIGLDLGEYTPSWMKRKINSNIDEDEFNKHEFTTEYFHNRVEILVMDLLYLTDVAKF